MTRIAAAPFVDVGALEDFLPDSTRRVARIESGSAVALFNLGGRLFALDDACVRCGGSLALGRRHATTVICPDCDWSYDIVTGCLENVPALCTDVFDVRIVDSRVMVALLAGVRRRSLL